MSSFGSGGPLIGANANQLLGQSPTINQVSASSPSFQPGTLPPSPLAVPQMPQSQPMSSIPGSAPIPNQMPVAPQAPLGQPAQAPNVMGQPQSSSESQMIIKALASRLASVSKSEEMLHNPTGQ